MSKWQSTKERPFLPRLCKILHYLREWNPARRLYAFGFNLFYDGNQPGEQVLDTRFQGQR